METSADHSFDNDPAMSRLESRLREAIDFLADGSVDPEDAYYDADGSRWWAVNGVAGGGGSAVAASEAQLRDIRMQCRILAATNEFAINGHENRISYIVGSGHTYRATPRDGDTPADLVAGVQAVIEEFQRENKWHKRQQEIVRRKDRDGECFLRFFTSSDGVLRLRFVEPDQVTTPPDRVSDPAASLGIVTDPQDVESVKGYFIDGQWVPGDEIQHRKANVDANVKRGLPLYYPVRKNLRRAEKLLRNMSVVAEIQSAIAIIRKHAAASRATMQQFVENGADGSVVHPASGRVSHFRRYGPGTILDAMAGMEYEFPAQAIDASRFVKVLQADLRAIASRLVMPEFMLTSDASNSNYSSTMVAEGPAVKMFQRLQADMLEDDLEVMWHAVAAAIRMGRLPQCVTMAVDIRGIPPTVAVRDRLQEAQADRILVKSRAMSVSTMAMRHGLDPDRESRLIAQDEAGVAKTQS
jgi:capsid protein